MYSHCFSLHFKEFLPDGRKPMKKIHIIDRQLQTYMFITTCHSVLIHIWNPGGKSNLPQTFSLAIIFYLLPKGAVKSAFTILWKSCSLLRFPEHGAIIPYL